MPSTRSLILLSLATTLDLLFLTLLLWALATHKGAKVWAWWVVALALALLTQGVLCEFNRAYITLCLETTAAPR